MPSDPVLSFTSAEVFFQRLASLFQYASINSPNESAIYGALSFILTVFCASTTVTATKFKNLYLGSFPQKDLKASETKKYRVPDFSVLVVQSPFGLPPTANKIGDMGALICEVKASQDRVDWFGPHMSNPPDLPTFFMVHFPQLSEQVVFAKAKFYQKAVYVLLTVDIWFTLFYFPADPPPVTWNKSGKPQLDPKTVIEFDRYMAIPPTPMVNENCTAFSPEFLHALQLSVKHLPDITVTSHPFFDPPEGMEERVAAQLKERQFRAQLQEEAQRVQRENRFALGYEDSDERSAGWSTLEESETDHEHQKHPATVPNTLDHCLTSPAKTRSKTVALRSRATMKGSDQPGTSNAENTGVPPITQNATPGRRAGPPRLRRKIEDKAWLSED